MMRINLTEIKTAIKNKCIGGIAVGMAAVIGILVFVVCSVITLLAFNVVTRGNQEEAMQ